MITLIPKTHKAKNKIREAGTDQFEILREVDKVLFSDETGPWLLIAPVGDTEAKKSRWVHKTNDLNFSIK